jgi:hypothetical protein
MELYRGTVIVANQKKGAIRSCPVSLEFSHRRVLLYALCWVLLEFLAVSPLCAERKAAELRYQFEEPCANIPRCRTECEISRVQSQELDLCFVEGQRSVGGVISRCSLEQALEMRAFYTVVGCVIYFYPSLEIPLSQGL